MVKQFLKKKSKRVGTRTRSKIDRKVREHNRKARRDAKRNPSKTARRDPGVPNSLPFKEAILQEAEINKQRIEEEKELMKKRQKQFRQQQNIKNKDLSSLVEDAENRGKKFETKNAFLTHEADMYNTKGRALEGSLKAYYKEFKKVIDNADVIIQVLDARDPIGSRCPNVEQAVFESPGNKKLVLILNKIDLVPRENVEKWLTYLRKQLPTVAFKASTQSQKDHLSHSKIATATASDDLRRSSTCLGAGVLMKLLANYCRNQNIKTTIRVGVVGFPNTGKSSIINSLKRSRACNVGAVPGVTRQMQEVQLDKHIRLLDSPGIVMESASQGDMAILRNCVKVETLDDPLKPVEVILKRCNKNNMMLHYNIGDYTDVQEFVALLAVRLGKVKKGGYPDVNKAAKIVLQDWNSGKITFYTEPPMEQKETHLAASIVTEMGKLFDIDSIISDEQNNLKDLRNAQPSDILVDSLGTVDAKMIGNHSESEESDDEDDMADDDEQMELGEEVKPQPEVVVMEEKDKTKKKKAKKLVAKPKQVQPDGMETLNSNRKKDFKKMKKNRRRADKISNDLNDAMTNAFDKIVEEDYNFTEAFK